MLCSVTGVGNGARVAAAVGTRCRGDIAGFVLMSYPLNVSVELLLQTKGTHLLANL